MKPLTPVLLPFLEGSHYNHQLLLTPQETFSFGFKTCDTEAPEPEHEGKTIADMHGKTRPAAPSSQAFKESGLNSRASLLSPPFWLAAGTISLQETKVSLQRGMHC